MTTLDTDIPWAALREAALAARAHAYAPYSQYLVGAALLDADGHVHRGANVENASYGLCLCAERSAFARAIADGVRSFRAILVMTDGDRPGTPCGMCRQVLAELAPSIPVRCETVGGARLDSDVPSLLPLAFDAERLP
ncbi:MAG: cytidine deaminase [Polyangiales bacterium]|nr:cytidine deaminase [Myxococcales bacterium]MCB9660103.1 cytidine deaminase [Sandaracinaceae bacterium]